MPSAEKYCMKIIFNNTKIHSFYENVYVQACLSVTRHSLKPAEYFQGKVNDNEEDAVEISRRNIY